jgi:hypothetical protein
MTTEEALVLGKLFDEFSSPCNVVGAYHDAGGTGHAPQVYSGTVHMMDKTMFVMAVLELQHRTLGKSDAR